MMIISHLISNISSRMVGHHLIQFTLIGVSSLKTTRLLRQRRLVNTRKRRTGTARTRLIRPDKRFSFKYPCNHWYLLTNRMMLYLLMMIPLLNKFQLCLNLRSKSCLKLMRSQNFTRTRRSAGKNSQRILMALIKVIQMETTSASNFKPTF